MKKFFQSIVTGLLFTTSTCMVYAQVWTPTAGNLYANPNTTTNVGIGPVVGSALAAKLRVQVSLSSGGVATGISTFAGSNAPATGGATGLDATGNTNVTGQNATGVFANATHFSGTSGTAFGVFAKANIFSCTPVPSVPTSTANYAIGLYGTGFANGPAPGFTACPANAWALYADGRTFTPGGIWTASDERLKANIRNIPTALDMVTSLQPKMYDFKADAQYANTHLAKGLQYGFLAQDVEKILPQAVTDAPLFLHNKGADNPTGDVESIKAINYTVFIPLLTQAIKEQQRQIEALQSTIAALKKERSTEMVLGAKLYQNQPNPFANNTIIRYDLPTSVKQASLLLYDMQGKQLRQIPLSGRNAASITLAARELGAGMYFYTLIADGREVETKKMILTER